MMLSEGDQGQYSWAAFLNGPIQKDYQNVLDAEFAFTAYDAKGRTTTKVDRTDCGAGCSAPAPKKVDKTDCGAGCSAPPRKKVDKTDCGAGCSVPPPKPGPYKQKAQGWFTKPV